MTLVVVLHDLGAPDGGDAWRTAVPDPTWEVLEQPGHGAAPPPRTGAYDPMAVVTLARWRVARHGVAGSTVVGVGENAHAAALLAAGDACGRLVLVDGLWGPWEDGSALVAAGNRRIRGILADPAAVGPAPVGLVDPRTRHGYGITATPRLVRPFWGAVTAPTLLVETPASPTPPEERVERVSWFGGPTTLVEVPDAAPGTVVAAIADWQAR